VSGAERLVDGSLSDLVTPTLFTTRLSRELLFQNGY